MSDNSVQQITHTPNRIQIFFFNVGGCLLLEKGATINGIEIKESVKLCTRDSIPTLTQAIEKLGIIKIW